MHSGSHPGRCRRHPQTFAYLWSPCRTGALRANWKQLWVPPGFAHGYITLESDCEVIYKVTDYWAPESERGIAWNDPGLGIDWRYSASDIIIADKDRSHPCLADVDPGFHYNTRKA